MLLIPDRSMNFFKSDSERVLLVVHSFLIISDIFLCSFIEFTWIIGGIPFRHRGRSLPLNKSIQNTLCTSVGSCFAVPLSCSCCTTEGAPPCDRIVPAPSVLVVAGSAASSPFLSAHSAEHLQRQHDMRAYMRLQEG